MGIDGRREMKGERYQTLLKTSPSISSPPTKDTIHVRTVAMYHSSTEGLNDVW